MGRMARVVVPLLVVAAAVTACGSTDDGAGGDGPRIVVTTSVLGDIVSSLVGDAASVTVLMGPGVSPHDFQASARQAAELREADLVVTNGAGFEQGLVDLLDAAEADGAHVHEAISAVDTLELGVGRDGGHDHGDDEAHDGDEGDPDHDDVDPHFFTDPTRTAVAARGILDALVAQVPALDTPAVRATADAYLADLDALDAEIEDLLAAIPEADRILVTNHEALGYFADRYGFELVGAVVPATTTTDTGNAADLAALEQLIVERGVPAIFADTSSPARLAERLAADVGGVEVVALFTESLGDADSGADTYLGMVRTNARRIADALS